jgi:protein phosphatase PTC7
MPDEKYGDIRDMTYMGIADGVGSWRSYGVDPREFSHALMKECENVLMEASDAALQRKEDGLKPRGIRPGEILAQAYDRVKEQNVIGSSTACVAVFDSIRHQLHFSNLGDSGIIVLRHIDSDVAGALKRNRKTPRTERKSDLQAVFVSQQQLHSFNHPFQLGWTGEELKEGEKTSFSEAKSACTTSIHVRRGDVIIMATDGLFDNVDIDEIASVAVDWEKQNGFLRGGDIDAREQRWVAGSSLTDVSYERIPTLADFLVKKARENSLDPTMDSPFALLAKDNDIMWSGGTFSVVRDVYATRYTHVPDFFLFATKGCLMTAPLLQCM